MPQTVSISSGVTRSALFTTTTSGELDLVDEEIDDRSLVIPVTLHFPRLELVQRRRSP